MGFPCTPFLTVYVGYTATSKDVLSIYYVLHNQGHLLLNVLRIIFIQTLVLHKTFTTALLAEMTVRAHNAPSMVLLILYQYGVVILP